MRVTLTFSLAIAMSSSASGTKSILRMKEASVRPGFGYRPKTNSLTSVTATHIFASVALHTALTVAGALQVGPFVQELSEKLITKAIVKRESDLMIDLCREIPPRVVTHLMRLSEENHVKFVKWVNEVQYGDFFTTRESAREAVKPRSGVPGIRRLPR